jgi:hypothetical protein
VPMFEWTNEARIRSLIAFANVEVGLSRSAPPSRKRLKAAPKGEKDAEKARKALSETKKELQASRASAFVWITPSQSRTG